MDSPEWPGRPLDGQGTVLHLLKKDRVHILKYLVTGEWGQTVIHPMDHEEKTPLEKFIELKDMKWKQVLKGNSEECFAE